MQNIIRNLYLYFTDFCINAANLLGITYVEFNFWLFIVVFPLTLIVLLFLNVFKKHIFKKRLNNYS